MMLLKDFGEGETDEATRLQITAAAYEIGLVMDSVFNMADSKSRFLELPSPVVLFVDGEYVRMCDPTCS